MALWSGFFAKPAPTPLTSRPSLTLFFLLVGAFLLTLVPHAVQFPFWVTVAVVGAMVLRSIIEFYRLPLPSSTFCGILALALAGAICVQYGTLAGREAGTALTAGLLAIKFYELRRPRDVSLIIFSCFFVVMSALLYSQILELFIYCLIMMWVLTALLLRVHTGDLPNDHLLQLLGKAGLIFVQSLPLTIILFFFFPRYTGPPLSLMLEGATIGLNSTVSPGSIAKLSQDNTEAMYVKFLPSANAPAIDTMYWRALVLWKYQKGIWTPGSLAAVELPKAAVPERGGMVFSQEITIKPHNHRWLFALDVPVSEALNKVNLAPTSVYQGDILQLQGGMLDHQARYEVTSSTVPPEEELGATEEARSIETDQIDPRVKVLADQLHEGIAEGQTQEYVSAVLKYFRHGGFVYRTDPGIQGADWLPVFLFQTKTGFCEHFASAFAVLMRLKNVPTRLVVGYQGADYNPYADNYIVYQSNAHAWDEVWIGQKDQSPPWPEGRKGHWMRVDPTAILSGGGGLPANQTTDAEDTLSSQVAHHRESLTEAYLPTWAKDALRELQLRREEVETSWDNLVFSYDPDAQYRLAQALGFGEKAGLYLTFVCVLAGGLCLVIFQKWTMRKPPINPVESLYAAFCRNMAQRGIPRAAWEGPLAYTERVAEAFPDDKPTLQRFGTIVAQVRYGPEPGDPTAPHHLKSLLTLLTASQAAAASRDRR